MVRLGGLTINVLSDDNGGDGAGCDDLYKNVAITDQLLDRNFNID